MYYVLNTVQRASCAIHHLLPVTGLWGAYYYYPDLSLFQMRELRLGEAK